MNLNDLHPAIERVRTTTPEQFSRGATYLRTYPFLLALGRASNVDDSAKFHQLATMAYGWMPRILRLDQQYLDDAIVMLGKAKNASDANCADIIIDRVAACLHSVVGASKVLHFANPCIFPIWDKKVEGFRLSVQPSQNHMDKTINYLAYVRCVNGIRGAQGFGDFYAEFNRAFENRLHRLKIDSYRLTEVRAIETAAFELSGDDTENG